MSPASKALEDRLGYHFEQPGLLSLALTHSSTAQGPDGPRNSNERLEFLGDRVFGLVVAQLLFETFPDEEEGALARRHAMLVRREALAEVAESVGLADHIVLSRGEEDAGGRHNPSLLADACEAVIAALYLEGGLGVASRFIREHWTPLMYADPTPPKDPKTALQEWAQGRGLPLPRYREIGREGPDHAPLFEVEVSLQGIDPAVGSGPSKRSAERAAAAVLLSRAEDGDVGGHVG